MLNSTERIQLQQGVLGWLNLFLISYDILHFVYNKQHHM